MEEGTVMSLLTTQGKDIDYDVQETTDTKQSLTNSMLPTHGLSTTAHVYNTHDSKCIMHYIMINDME